MTAALIVLAQERVSVDVGSILGWVVIGLVVGILARLIVPGTGGMSWVLTIVLGILGAIIGGYLAGAVFGETPGVDWISSVVVAVILVWIAVVAGKRSTAV